MYMVSGTVETVAVKKVQYILYYPNAQSYKKTPKLQTKRDDSISSIL